MINFKNIFCEKSLLWQCHSFSKPISNNAGKYSNKKRFISTPDLVKFQKHFGNEIIAFGSGVPKMPFSKIAICTIFNQNNFNQKADLANYEKHITDTLVMMQIIQDDSFKHVKANLQIGGKLEKDIFFQVKIFKME